MMKSNILVSLTDVLYIFLLRMKLIRNDRTTVVVFFLSVVLFAVLIQSLSISAKDQSTLPVGIVDYDKSSNSKELVLGLKKVETLRIIENSEVALQKLLLDERITSIFVIEDGYDKRIRNGDLKDIITMYYKKDNKSASILSDIVAGEMIYPAIFYKGLRYYKQIHFNGKKHTPIQYENYMEELLKNSSDFDFAFCMIYTNPGKTVITEQPISNSVLYNQFIFGILGILIAFIAMFLLSGTLREKDLGVELRLTISGFDYLKRDIGNLFALFVTEGLLAIIFSSLIFLQFQSKDLMIWISAYLLLIINAFVIGGVLLLITKIIGKMHLYQVFCSALILLTGGLGFYQLLTGFYQGFADKMVKIIPNSWFIQGFTDIIVYGKDGGYLKEGHWVLLEMATGVILVVIIIDLFQGNSFNHRKKS